MTAILITGATGMLGKALVEQGMLRGITMIPQSRADLDISSYPQIKEVLGFEKPDIVINAAGLIPAKYNGVDSYSYSMVNGIGPFYLSVACNELGIRLVQVSTDCVFTGRTPGPHKTTELPDAFESYGFTKGVGENLPKDVAVVRTSFIGPDHGLLPWLYGLRQMGVEGYLNAKWSGSTVWEVARGLLDISVSRLTGVVHLATQRAYSKYEVLEILKETFGWSVVITPTETPVIDRSLESTIYLGGLDSDEVKNELRGKCPAYLS